MVDQLWTTPDDVDAEETQEWLDALAAVLEHDGPERAHFLIEALVEKARRSGAYLPYSANTAYVNTIAPANEEKRPGDPALERRIKSIIRWSLPSIGPIVYTDCRMSHPILLRRRLDRPRPWETRPGTVQWR